MKILMLVTASCMFLFLSIPSVFSQSVGINTDGSDPDYRTILDVKSNSKGILFPRMTDTERDALLLDLPEGMLIYNTTDHQIQMFLNNFWYPLTMGTPENCLPAAPGDISGNTTVTENSSGKVYNITAVSGATAYYWTVPAGASISGGQGTTSITVTFGSASGNVRVRSENACGNSIYTNLAVTVNPVFICGNSLTITHTTGNTAPVTKTVTYGTVETALTGSNKCWITKNLGADNQASSATDATEASAGWYWQFNRQQGYNHDGTTLTPDWTLTSINEGSNWIIANDPCNLLLGEGWRLPTQTELENIDNNGSWGNYTDTYSSVLKLHAAGYLNSTNGSVSNRGTQGNYWSNTQNSVVNGYDLYFNNSSSSVIAGGKAYGFSVRCLKD